MGPGGAQSTPPSPLMATCGHRWPKGRETGHQRRGRAKHGRARSNDRECALWQAPPWHRLAAQTAKPGPTSRPSAPALDGVSASDFRPVSWTKATSCSHLAVLSCPQALFAQPGSARSRTCSAGETHPLRHPLPNITLEAAEFCHKATGLVARAHGTPRMRARVALRAQRPRRVTAAQSLARATSRIAWNLLAVRRPSQ